MSEPTQNAIIPYESEDGSIAFDVPLENETVWLNQKQMALLFGTTKQNIGQHTRNVFKEKELIQDSVVKDFFTTAEDGKSYNIKHYNLDVIISVGYRVKSQRGVQFRQWATKILRDYLLYGYSLNTKKILELEKDIKEIKKYIKNRKVLDEEIVVTLKNLVEHVYDVKLAGKKGLDNDE